MLKDEVTILKDYDKVLLKGKDTGLVITKVVTNLTYPFKVCYFPCKNMFGSFKFESELSIKEHIPGEDHDIPVICITDSAHVKECFDKVGTVNTKFLVIGNRKNNLVDTVGNDGILAMCNSGTIAGTITYA